MNIFLDDVRVLTDMSYMNKANIYFQNKFEVVRNVDEFKKILDNSNEKIEIISFDHDLLNNHYGDLAKSAKSRFGNGQEALYYLVDWVNRNNIKYKINILFHTMNYHGLKEMIGIFNEQILDSQFDDRNINLIDTTPERYLVR